MKVIQRNACRAILLTPQNEVLLIKLSNPNGNWTGWITAGGGIDEGENDTDALRRELREELGVDLFSESSSNAVKVWKRSDRFPWRDQMIEQNEVFYLIKLPHFEVATQTNLTETEMMDFKEIRWWKIEDIKNSDEVFVPRDLYRLVTDLVQNGPPSEVIEVK